MSKFGRKVRTPPPGFEYVEPILSAMDTELREQVNAPHEGLRKTESQWPVHQINWQRSRYIYDLYYTYEKISREVYDYCINNKLVDAALIAKWKKPGYERLCSTFAINPRNYKFGTVSICRVPRHALPPGTEIEDPNTGCRGCASGSGGNIFGNKYGQYLAAIQIAREERAARLAAAHAIDNDDDDEDDDVPGPTLKVGSKRPVGSTSSHASSQPSKKASLGPVGAADGGTGEIDSIWAEADDEVDLEEGMIGKLIGDAEKEGRAAARSLGKSSSSSSSSSSSYYGKG